MREAGNPGMTDEEVFFIISTGANICWLQFAK